MCFYFKVEHYLFEVQISCGINEQGNNTIILVDTLKGNKGGERNKLLDSIMSASNKKTEK